MSSPSLWLAFIGGLLAFFSPCVLPLIPSYLSLISGLSLKEYSGSGEARRRTVISSVFFIIGFSLVFIALGATASLLGQLLFRYKELIRLVGAVLVVLLGLYLIGVFRLPFLDYEKHFQPGFRRNGYWGSFLIGITFAAAWTPCVGPILAAILTLAGASATLGQGVLLLAVFSLGLGLPFFISSLALNSLLVRFKRIDRYMWVVTWLSGLVLIAAGILLLTDNFSYLMYNLGVVK